jgi:hypothetical protein
VSRDIDPPGRESLPRERPQARPEAAAGSRDPQPIRERGYLYQISLAELEVIHDIGRFRTIDMKDLARYRYRGNSEEMRQDLRSLKDQGLIEQRTVWFGDEAKKLSVVVLTKQGKAIVERKRDGGAGQQIYAGFVKAREARHDAAIYRMYQAEVARLEEAGARIRRLILDYELKQKVYSPLAKAKSLSPAEYARRQAEVAQANGLKVIQGKIPLPDLRIEYETSAGDITRVDLELATEHYRPSHMQGKAAAGFKLYAADGSAAHLSRVLEEREITAAIFSL